MTAQLAVNEDGIVSVDIVTTVSYIDTIEIDATGMQVEEVEALLEQYLLEEANPDHMHWVETQGYAAIPTVEATEGGGSIHSIVEVMV